jgi:hypothetical protein
MWLASRDFNDQPPEFTRGPWGGVTNAFLSVRMALQGGYHFGWIQLAFKLALIEGSTNMYWMRFQIPDCGLNAVPGEAIKAGQR